MWQLFGLFIGSAAFEFAYVAWARSTSSGRPLQTTAYSMLVAGLGLAGVGGALNVEHGVIAYLGGIGLGAYVSAYLAKAKAQKSRA